MWLKIITTTCWKLVKDNTIHILRIQLRISHEIALSVDVRVRAVYSYFMRSFCVVPARFICQNVTHNHQLFKLIPTYKSRCDIALHERTFFNGSPSSASEVLLVWLLRSHRTRHRRWFSQKTIGSATTFPSAKWCLIIANQNSNHA